MKFIHSIFLASLLISSATGIHATIDVEPRRRKDSRVLRAVTATLREEAPDIVPSSEETSALNKRIRFVNIPDDEKTAAKALLILSASETEISDDEDSRPIIKPSECVLAGLELEEICSSTILKGELRKKHYKKIFPKPKDSSLSKDVRSLPWPTVKEKILKAIDEQNFDDLRTYYHRELIGQNDPNGKKYYDISQNASSTTNVFVMEMMEAIITRLKQGLPLTQNFFNNLHYIMTISQRTYISQTDYTTLLETVLEEFNKRKNSSSDSAILLDTVSFMTWRPSISYTISLHHWKNLVRTFKDYDFSKTDEKKTAMLRYMVTFAGLYLCDSATGLLDLSRIKDNHPHQTVVDRLSGHVSKKQKYNEESYKSTVSRKKRQNTTYLPNPEMIPDELKQSSLYPSYCEEGFRSSRLLKAAFPKLEPKKGPIFCKTHEEVQEKVLKALEEQNLDMFQSYYNKKLMGRKYENGTNYYLLADKEKAQTGKPLVNEIADKMYAMITNQDIQLNSAFYDSMRYAMGMSSKTYFSQLNFSLLFSALVGRYETDKSTDLIHAINFLCLRPYTSYKFNISKFQFLYKTMQEHSFNVYDDKKTFMLQVILGFCKKNLYDENKRILDESKLRDSDIYHFYKLISDDSASAYIRTYKPVTDS